MSLNDGIILLDSNSSNSKINVKDEQEYDEDKLAKNDSESVYGDENKKASQPPPLHPSQPPLPPSLSSQTQLSIDKDANLINLININRKHNIQEKSNYHDDDNETSLDHLNDLYLRYFLAKMLTYLGMDNLKQVKETKRISNSSISNRSQLKHNQL